MISLCVSEDCRGRSSTETLVDVAYYIVKTIIILIINYINNLCAAFLHLQFEIILIILFKVFFQSHQKLVFFTPSSQRNLSNVLQAEVKDAPCADCS